MGQRNQSSKRPQAKHTKKHSPSQFDKRSRLTRPNSARQNTTSAKIPLVGTLASMVNGMAQLLDSRIAFRLAIVMAGMIFAGDRRVAASWFTSAGVQDDWDCFYDALASFGRKSKSLSLSLLWLVLKKFDSDAAGRFVLAIDDSPTQRYGKCVEGAGVHHNPTPGPVGSPWMYGHNWVALSLLATHRAWGVIALPLLSLLYVRACDVPRLNEKYGWKFQTKHQLALELVTWFVEHARWARKECQIWLVVDGAYAARSLLSALLKLGVVVFSRMRCDAVLHDLPARPTGNPGRPRTYGKNRINLSKRAAHRHGWESVTWRCRGSEVTRLCKTFLATSRLTGGVIRVVLVKFESGGWAAYFCSNPEVSVRDLLETISARWAIEEFFHDVKEVWGAGQQQVRNVWSNIGCWHLNQWIYTMVELCSWDSPKEELAQRSDRPWDNLDRRPSHADRRRAISHEMLRKQLLNALPEHPIPKKFQALLEHLIRLAA